jgi:stage II sporulation protein R
MRINNDFNMSLLRVNMDNLYRKIVSFCFLILIFVLLFVQYLNSTTYNTQLQEGIASEVLRFHVIANSDSAQDQAVKLKIKDALTKSLEPTLKNAKNIDEARALINESLYNLELLSNQIIKENGYDYTATASIERGYFPLKVYGDLSLPPGEYEAVRIELGSATGQNWWCIMFPPLCFVDSTYSIVPDTSKEQLKYVLTDDEYEAVFYKKEVNVKVKFKIFSWLEGLF